MCNVLPECLCFSDHVLAVSLHEVFPVQQTVIKEADAAKRHNDPDKQFSDLLHKGHLGPMPDGGAKHVAESSDEDEVAIMQMEKSMAKALSVQRKRQKNARFKKAHKFVKRKKPRPKAVAKAVAKAKAAAAPDYPDVRAAPRANQVTLNGRNFTKLQDGGLSMVCDYHADCMKYCGAGMTEQLEREEIRRRLLAWEADGIGCNDAASHIKLGGKLLRDYRDVSEQFADA